MTKPREKKREELQAEIEDGKKKIRQLDKLVDELAKGKPMESILR